MLKNKLNNKKKKNGFTLIELVIVLAVLAIIAVIAIPNFTKVKDRASIQADEINRDQISNITKLVVTEGILDPSTTNFTIIVGTGDEKSRIDIGGSPVYGQKPDGTAYSVEDLQERFIDVEKPQIKGAKGYNININTDGRVIVTTTPTA